MGWKEVWQIQVFQASAEGRGAASCGLRRAEKS